LCEQYVIGWKPVVAGIHFNHYNEVSSVWIQVVRQFSVNLASQEHSPHSDYFVGVEFGRVESVRQVLWPGQSGHENVLELPAFRVVQHRQWTPSHGGWFIYTQSHGVQQHALCDWCLQPRNNLHQSRHVAQYS